jgi:hypothetical protein
MKIHSNIHSEELVGPVIPWPKLEAEQRQEAILEEQNGMLDHLDQTIQHAREAAEEVEWLESGIIDPLPMDWDKQSQ